MTHHASPRAGRGSPSAVLAVSLVLALFSACSGVEDEGVGVDAGGTSMDANGAIDASLVTDTGPVDAAACPGALGCDCESDDECASGLCENGICAIACAKDCDDSNACTVDLCVAATSVDASATCSHTAGAAGEPCSDGTLCTTGDACASGACVGAAVDCDDGSSCTTDWCHPAEGCKHDVSDAACDDGDVCTVGDSCVKGGCAPGKPQNCEDGNPCTTDTCDKNTGCKHEATNGNNCNDGDACTSGDTCVGSKCAGGEAVACDDGKACTKDVCDPGTGKGDGGCIHTFADGAACDDGSVCTIGDVCKAGACISGKAQPCDDGNPCTMDACDAQKGCNSTPLKAGTSCDDGNACSTGDTCVAGTCSAGKALACDDGNICTKDTCDLTKGCVNVATDGGKCVPAGNSCTVGGVCAATLCKPVAQIGCDDGQPCTKDACDKASGKCVFTPLKEGSGCNDGAACTVGDVCTAGLCVGGKTSCDDNNVCTSDSCDGVKGCIYTPIANAGCTDGNVCTVGDTCKAGKCAPGALQNCDDKNACTDDVCDAKLGCAPKNNTAPCDDANACTTKDVCSGGVCKGGAAKLCDDGNPCTIDLCHPGADGGKSGCQFINDNKSGCSDDNVCTTGDACLSGKCIPGKLQLCDDENVCTLDVCDPKKGCIGTPNTASCSDNDVCTVGDVCKLGKCVAGPYQNCDDQNACTVDACNPKTGCTHVLTAAQCDDGNACTVGDTCIGGKCKPGKSQICEDANACTNDGCDTVKGCVNVPNMAPCDDGNACSLGDVCSKGSCVAGSQTKNCDDLDICTQDLCYPGVGCKHFANSAPCDDGNACTTSDSCANFKCAAGPKLDCDDQNLCTNDACNPKTGCTHALNGNKPFGPLIDDASQNSGLWEFKASTGPVRFTHAGTGWYALSAPQTAEHTMTLQAKVDLACAFNPTLYFDERFNGGSYWVEISDDGAKTWSPSLIRGGKSDYIWRTQGLDLKGYKGKKILVRFRAKTSSTSHWWNIRNIAVREADPAPKTVSWGTKLSCANIATEGPGWACNIDGNSFQLNYKRHNMVPNPNIHISTARFMLRFDVSKVANPYLTFEERHYYGILKVESRSPGGPWAESFLRSWTKDYAWRKRVVDLSDFKGDVIELRFTTRNPNNSYAQWGDVRHINFGVKPAPKADLPYGKPLASCTDWTVEDAVWTCDATNAEWLLQGKGDASTTKAANGYWHYARFERQIDLSKYKAPVLMLEHSANYGSKAVQVSTDGGTWSKVWTQGNTPDKVWRKVNVDLGQFLGKKVWIRLAYVPSNASYWWKLRNIRVEEAPKPWPIVGFSTPAHDCGAWTPETPTWQCDPAQAKYQFRYAAPVGEPAGYWVSLTNQRVYKLAGQTNPHMQVEFRHYYGSVKIQASADGVQWDDLYSVGSTHDLVWRKLTLSLGAYKTAGTVRFRFHVLPASPAYWGEFRNFKLLNVSPAQVVKPSAAFKCAGWEFEGGAWGCKSTGGSTTLRYEGQPTIVNVNPNAYSHYVTTAYKIDLAGLKKPTLRATMRHYYGTLNTQLSTDGKKWHVLDTLASAHDRVWRKRAFDLSSWLNQKVFIRFSSKPGNASYWGEVKDIAIDEYVAPAVAKPGDVVKVSDLSVEGGWTYDFVNKRFQGSHEFVNHYQALQFKKRYDFTNATKPVLRFEHAWLHGYGYVDVSLDGTSWKSLWYRSFHGKRSAVMTPDWVDLSSVKGLKGVYIRFRHYSYNYDIKTASYWGVNKIQVVEYKASPTRKAPTQLTTNDFERRGLWAYNASTKEFSLNKPTQATANLYVSSSHFLWPKVALDLSKMSNPVLRFQQRNQGISRYAEVSEDDGQTWKSAGAVVSSSTGVWQEFMADLSPWKQSKALLIRLRGHEDKLASWWQVRSLEVVEKPTLKSKPAGYTAKISEWALESGWNQNTGLNLLERKAVALNEYSSATSTVTWDLSNATAPKLVFDTSYASATRQVYVSLDGFTWQLITSQSGTQSTLTTQTVDLAKFAGTKALQVRLKSHISSIDRYWRVKNLKVVAK